MSPQHGPLEGVAGREFDPGSAADSLTHQCLSGAPKGTGRIDVVHSILPSLCGAALLPGQSLKIGEFFISIPSASPLRIPSGILALPVAIRDIGRSRKPQRRARRRRREGGLANPLIEEIRQRKTRSKAQRQRGVNAIVKVCRHHESIAITRCKRVPGQYRNPDCRQGRWQGGIDRIRRVPLGGSII